MACKWCGSTTNRNTARFCNSCAAPLLDGVPLVNFVSGSWLHGRYQIRKLLGAGAMGTVYGALDNNLPGRRVAVKELDPQRISNPLDRQPAAQMFQDEAQTLARLDHPNIVKVSDYFLEGQRQYQVMDYVDGSTLEEVQSRRRTVPEYQIVEWSRQLCDALNYLHTQKPPVIFRDLKPGNIMLDKNGHVKLIDFGIARRFKTGKSKDTQQMGTPGFAPPEQHGSGQTDARSDIYALCATMYALLTGYDVSNSPFQFPPIRTFSPMVSQKTEMAIMRGLELEPQRRWQSVQELGNWLLGAPIAPGGTAPVGGQPGQVGQAGGATKPFTRPTQRLGAMLAQLTNMQLAVALVVFTVAAAAVSWAFTPVLSTYPVFWDNVDFSAIVAALAYAAVRRRWVAGISLAVIASVGGIVIQSRLGYPASASIHAILYAIAAGAFVEIWLAMLPRVRGRLADAWQREVAWFALMAVIATVIVRLDYQASYAFQPGLWIVSAGLGGLGWLIGDSFQQTLHYRLTGYQRPGHL